MKTIGFIDYYISEWHANNYPEWIKTASSALGLDYQVKYAYASLDVSPVDGITTDEWCEKYGIERCMTIEEICNKADYLLILAPSDPDEHPALAKEALKCGKKTYIDKTFASSYSAAVEIFNMAEASGAEIFSTSALRYADELGDFESPRSAITTGGGGNLPEYIIHQIEMGVKKLGVGAVSVEAYEEGEETVCKVAYNDERNLEMRYSRKNPFTFSNGDKTVKISSDFFGGLIRDILRFFNGEEAPVKKEDTLEVMKIREAAIRAYENLGTTVMI